jgi:signal transduction histidine kinase
MGHNGALASRLRPGLGRLCAGEGGTVLVAAAVGGLSLFMALSTTGLTPGPLLAADVAAGAAACLALPLRRRWPAGLALALLPLAAFSPACMGAQGAAVQTVAMRRRVPVALAVGCLYTVAGLVYWAPRTNRTQLLLLAAVYGLTYAALIALAMFLRARRQLVDSQRERARRAEAEQLLRLEQARHLERERIAREMHDVLAHRISLLSLHAGALEFHPDAPADEVARAAGVIRQNAHQALQDLRRVIGVLRDRSDGGPPEPPQPTLSGVPALIEDSRLAGMRLRFEERVGDLAAVPPDTGRDAYRVVQEALTNARKHAPSCEVVLAVAGDARSGLTIEVRNRLPAGGPREPEIPGTGTGIVGLTERVALAGGRLEHGPDGDGDYRLWAWLPWPE